MKNITHTAPHDWAWKFDFWECRRCGAITYSKNSVSFVGCAPRENVSRSKEPTPEE